ncbi:MAG: hypothetical protein OEW87_08085 [Flavobacteriaceae bacterium]|nr:hypothetical protein [Flavobacteriaceae bacterium]
MKYLLILLPLMVSSCALAPFAPETSGRSAGHGTLFASVGNTNNAYHLKFAMGLSKDVDLGFIMEFGDVSTSTLFFKYSFLNNKTGPALAGEFGYGSTETTKIYYLGIIGSLAFSEEFELFTNIRVNNVSTDVTDIEKNKFHGNIQITDYDLVYLQATVGFNVWFGKSTGLSLYSTYYKGEKIITKEDGVFGASLLFKF